MPAIFFLALVASAVAAMYRLIGPPPLEILVGLYAAALAAGAALARGGYTAGLIITIVALAASLAPLGLGFFLVPLFLPITLAMPSLALAPNRWLVANSLGVLIAPLLGLYGAQALLANR